MKTPKKSLAMVLLLSMLSGASFAQVAPFKNPKEPKPVLSLDPPSKVDFDAYEKLVAEVKSHRKARLVNLETFFRMSNEPKTIILDTRSDAMYKSKHVKGAIHLNFADFTQSNLAKIIPSDDYRILIYCNNNFDNDDLNFASKAYIPKPMKSQKEITLALNIPTYINLYGYGYKNVYELADLISVFDNRIEFEGTSVPKKYGK